MTRDHFVSSGVRINCRPLQATIRTQLTSAHVSINCISPGSARRKQMSAGSEVEQMMPKGRTVFMTADLNRAFFLAYSGR